MRTKAIVASLAFSVLSTSALAKELELDCDPAKEREPDYDPVRDDFSLQYACEDRDAKLCPMLIDTNENGRVSWDEITMFDYKQINQDEIYREVSFDDQRRSVNLYYAGLAGRAERYDERMNYMNVIAMMDGELTSVEREIFIETYETQLAKFLKSYRSITVSQDKHQEKLNQLYRKKIETEMIPFIERTIFSINKLIEISTDDETDPKFSTMRAFGYHTLCEITTDKNSRSQYIKIAEMYYEQAQSDVLLYSAMHPIILGLALKHSEFAHEYMDEPELAKNIAKEALLKATERIEFMMELNLEHVMEQYAKEQTQLMQQLRDNLDAWSGE